MSPNYLFGHFCSLAMHSAKVPYFPEEVWLTLLHKQPQQLQLLSHNQAEYAGSRGHWPCLLC